MAKTLTPEYHAYIASTAWQVKRAQAHERAGGKCQICNSSKNLDVHHRTYERFQNEEPWDLTVLCRSCHSLYHDRLPKPPKAAPKAKKAPLSKNDFPLFGECIREAVLSTTISPDANEHLRILVDSDMFPPPVDRKIRKLIRYRKQCQIVLFSLKLGGPVAKHFVGHIWNVAHSLYTERRRK